MYFCKFFLDFKLLSCKYKITFIRNHKKGGFTMKSMYFTLWDVEHGVSIWVVTPNGQNHWLDLGKTPDFSPTQYVAKTHKVKNIDYLLISHPDRDHIEDLPNLVQFLKYPRVLCRNNSLPDRKFSGSEDTEYKKIMHNLNKRYIAPVSKNECPTNPNYNGDIEYRQHYLRYGNFSDGSKLEGNNTSIVTFMLYQEVLFVYPGDIEPKGWNELWKQNNQDLSNFIAPAKVKILVAPHHGRKSGYSEEMMDVIEPNIVFISDIWGDSETHPSYYSRPSGFKMPNGQSIKYLSTKTKGGILCTVNKLDSCKIYPFEVEKNYNNQTPNPDLSI